LICFALCILALPAEDETIGSFDAVVEDPRQPMGTIKKILKLKKLMKLFG
jgi:hypothetical protein